ncbi:MAG TPA: hypothetical protein VGI39_31890 [Polyangiaceae bacterium]|jgi:hypothetical protein
MTNLSRILGALAATLCFVSYADEAKALGPIDLEVGLKGGYATNPDNVSGISNGLGPGFGARAGVGIFNLYGGVNVVRYFGENSLSAWEVGAEVGYSIKLSILTLRPQVGFGDMLQSVPAQVPGITLGDSFYLEPGLTALIGLGLLYVGADANALFLTSAGPSTAALTIHGQVGVKF